MAFRDVIGHERALKILQRGLATGRIYHAYLFTGMQGIGKQLVARAVAKVLNCLQGGADACEQCRVCQRINKQTYPDVLEVSPEGETVKIQQIRELQRAIGFKPYEAQWRVVIVDGAERMTREAANALLKTLEEPPPQTVLILVSTTIEGLPPTVLSRCQQIHFNPLSPEEVRQVLTHHLQHGDVDAPLLWAAGSPGRALRMEATDLQETKQQVVSTLGRNLADKLALANDLAKQDRAAKVFLEMLGVWIRDVVIHKETRDKRALFNMDLTDEVEKSLAMLDTKELLDYFWFLLKIQKGFEFHGNLQLSLESALLRLEGQDNYEAGGGYIR